MYLSKHFSNKINDVIFRNKLLFMYSYYICFSVIIKQKKKTTKIIKCINLTDRTNCVRFKYLHINGILSLNNAINI